MKYPETRSESTYEEWHGVAVPDPYRWLEGNDSEVLAWQDSQVELTESVLQTWPDLERLKAAQRKALLNGVSNWTQTPVFGGNLAFRLASGSQGVQAVLEVVDMESGQTRVLVDPNQMQDGQMIDWFYPSRGGELVAVGISSHGDEQSVLHLVDTKTGELLPERIPNTSYAVVTWLPDASGFYFSGGKASDLEDSQKWVFFHRVGDTTPPLADPRRFEAWYIAPQLSQDGRYLVVVVGEEDPRAAWYRDLLAGGEWKPLMVGKTGDSYGHLMGDSYVALMTFGAPRGRIVSVPLSTAQDESTWRELVHESEAVIRYFVLVDDLLVISELKDAVSQLRLVPLAGGEGETIELPGMGLIRGADMPNTHHLAVSGRQIFFAYTTFTRPMQTYRLDLDERSVEPFEENTTGYLGHLETRRIFYDSVDGVRVSMFLVYKKGLDISQPSPTLLHGYGGWNLVRAPGYVGGTLPGGYVVSVLPFIEAGGIYAFANLRGGAEYGREWWHGGRLESKQNTYNDLYAAAEWLIGSELTTSVKLAVMGSSNGGLLAAVAVTQRPDLWRVVVSQSPITDMLRCFHDPYTAACAVEYGSPEDPEMFRLLHDYSPVHNVRPGGYPSTMLQCGSSDVRCPAWNGRKLVAALQNASTSDRPVLLQVHKNMGHFADSSLESHITRDSTAIGFIMSQLGMRVQSEKFDTNPS
ncbi:MAG: S9 family peptidase [Anaerolineales bacterium]|nr:S9 family peptidase [Anaerolineales bacterium]